MRAQRAQNDACKANKSVCCTKYDTQSYLGARSSSSNGFPVSYSFPVVNDHSEFVIFVSVTLMNKFESFPFADSFETILEAPNFSFCLVT